MKDKLTSKQKAFIKEYLIDRNGKQAAIRVGYSPATAENQASRLLSKDKVRLVVKKEMQKHADKCEITRDAIRQEYERDRETARSLEHPQLNVSVAATEKIAKMYGLDGVTKVEHSGQDGGPILLWGKKLTQ
tara:strand:- start:314 stop:709 length:396 start_codon:yes stop_codon:yes gene_type:complete